MRIEAWLLGAAALAAGSAVHAQDAFEAFTRWKGTAMPLEAVAGGEFAGMARLAPDGGGPGRLWTVRQDGPWVRLGPAPGGKDACLDVVNGGPLDNFVELRPCGNFSGQLWSVAEEDGWFRLTTQFRGPSMCLDVVNGGPMDGFAHLAPCGRYSGQLWQMN